MSNAKILIAGGGIGGMAAAIALLQRGFDVEVFEQSDQVREFGAGIQISPNGNRVLDVLGVFHTLKARSCNAASKEIRLWNTGQTWTLFDLGGESIRKFGYPYLTVFRPDLLGVLADEVRRRSPDCIHVGAKVQHIEDTGQGVVLTLADGRTFHGDAVIGADGVHSRVRQLLFGVDEVQFSGMVAWRTLIPMGALPERFNRSVAINWIGPGGHVVHYPVQGGRMMNFVGTLEGATWPGPPYRASATREECAEAFSGWHEDVLAMIEHAPSVTRWALCGRRFLDTWTRGRATLLGDSCHPTLPFLAQGAVHTLEDAVVLARCLERHGIADGLVRYDEVRRPRTYQMMRGAADNTSRFHNEALRNEASAQAFVNREWQAQVISDRYDWLFSYRADEVEV